MAAYDYTKTPTTSRAAAERQGQQLALKLRFQTDPERAIHLAIPQSTKDQLPRSVAENIEEHVSGRGDFLVLGILAAPGHEKQVSPIRRLAVIDGRPYEAHVFGARSQQSSRKNQLMQITIGNELGLDENPPEGPKAQTGGTGTTPAGAAENSSRRRR